ncbi:MAG TPA: GntR family transcriptional regulator [Anaerovoracaceae bacterium]|nr:GntR family transcriptional regulator [Anaerovoracaceae bacterium]
MSEHKYTELANKLRSDIQTGVYTEGQKLPSENELAYTTGFSRQTVRQAMSLLENEGLTSRIRGSGTYVQSTEPIKPATHNIAVITTYIREYIFPAILHGIEDVLSKNGYTPMLCATHNRVDNERRLLTDFLQKPIDGLIVEGTKTALPNPNLDLYIRFHETGIPVVFINGYYPELKNPIYVVADDRAGGEKICGELLKKGHRRIAGIFKSDDIQGHRRYAGYADALRSEDIPISDDHVLWFTTESRDELLDALTMQTLKDCTAVVCYNDEVALKVLNVLQNNGVDVPGEIELVSFDNSTLAQLSSVKFLSLENPKEQLGQLAAQKLLNILQNKEEAPSVMPWGTE